jgi:NTE family protein
MARERAFLAEGPNYLPLRLAVDRLARQIGEMEVGLALGAGAAKGFAHIGVLRVLEENAVPIDYIVGCSIGAVVGAPYATGMRLAEIERRLQGANRKIVRWTLPFRSIWSDAGLKEILRESGPKVRFRDLNIPFAAVATDFATGREVVLRKGLVWRAVQASVSIPGIFPPVIISGRHLVDGGLVNPVPSQTARDMGANIVLAVDLMSPAGRAYENAGLPKGSSGNLVTRVPNLVEMLWRSTEIMQEEVTARSAATADITIEPKLGRVRWSDFSRRGQDFIAAGEEAAREKLPELRRLLPFAISGEEENGL